MDIRLENIHYSLMRSYETKAFSADFLVNGEKVGKAHNGGLGERTEVITKNWGETKIVKTAEEYCKALPPIIIPPSEHHPYPIEEPMTLYKMIDDMVETHINKTEFDLHQKKLQRKMEENIVIQKPGEMNAKTFIFSEPVNEVMTSKPALFQKIITNQVLPRLQEGYVIINNNIDPLKLQTFGVTTAQINPLPVVELKRKKKQVTAPDNTKSRQRPKK